VALEAFVLCGPLPRKSSPMTSEPIHETPAESRQATKTPRSMRYVLVLGMAGVVIAFVIAFLAVGG